MDAILEIATRAASWIIVALGVVVALGPAVLGLGKRQPEARRADAWAWLKNLDPQDRRLMLMFLADRMTAGEMAAATGWSARRVRTRIYELMAAHDGAGKT